LTTALVPVFAETLPHERDADYYYGYASDGQTYTLSAVLTATYDLDLPSVGNRFLYTLRP
ncbi:MAG: hypothetical protein HY341_03195, partial [Candidatus Kerfeldbacteria bacterium]|nr:hypothetical protein [Candidatus Kerfeldbacteria bacterium]